MLQESLEGLSLREGGTYADLTFGGGGHSRAILSALKGGRLIALDQDPEAHAHAPLDDRLTMVHGNFRYITQYLRYLKAIPLDGILADLGISSHQIDEGRRGFSTRTDARLDMRMDPQMTSDAARVVNEYTVEALEAVFRNYGELPSARKLSASIIRIRAERPIATTGDLVLAVKPFTPSGQEHKFLAQVFQALRIAVNDEIEALKEMLLQVPSLLKPGGRLVVIAYHSLEDRLVKHFMRSGNFEDKPEADFYGNRSLPFRLITRKAVVPTAQEITRNNRARSARLRVAERI
ncbi:MAG TPA: 16S rRNA (cytosine(1402)-N(4))-methyltransferase RsmH [Bacteroidales bacterium]|nr:16S rRNA (cytosine(1402)-N(4))-methyltransferase RsmH [Bacteroidales bacterium]